MVDFKKMREDMRDMSDAMAALEAEDDIIIKNTLINDLSEKTCKDILKRIYSYRAYGDLKRKRPGENRRDNNAQNSNKT